MKTYPTLFNNGQSDPEVIFNSFQWIGEYHVWFHILCLVCGLHGVWCLFQGSWHDTIMLYLLMLNCRGGGLYVVCACQVCDCYMYFAVVATGTGVVRPFFCSKNLGGFLDALNSKILLCPLLFLCCSCCLCFAFACSVSNSRFLVWKRVYH